MPKIEYEHYGACNVKNSAFSEPLKLVSALDPDYQGDFAEPSSPAGCCVVLRHAYGTKKQTSTPRRCRGRRKLWNPNRPQVAWMCCQAHATREKEAREWYAERLVRDGEK